MIILKEDGKQIPFAVVTEDNNPEKIKKAIEVEFDVNLDEIKLSSILIPDWGDVDYFSWASKDSDGSTIGGNIQITKVVSY